MDLCGRYSIEGITFEVRRVYNRTSYIERRRPMMEWWSEHIQQAATGSLSIAAINEGRARKVVPIR